MFIESRLLRDGDRQLEFGWTAGSRAGELFAELGKAGDEAAVRKKELSFLQAHETVEAIFLAGAIVAKGRLREVVPLALLRLNPLTPKQDLALQVTVGTTEIFAERVKSAEPL